MTLNMKKWVMCLMMVLSVKGLAHTPNIASEDPIATTSLNKNEFSFILELVFAPNQSDTAYIAAEGQADLVLLANQLSRFTRLNQVRITAYANDTSDKTHNLALAQQRARVIRDYLLAQGVLEEMVFVRYFDAMGNASSGRRVEIEVYGRGYR